MTKNTWVLVGDGSHARIFDTGDGNGPWLLVRKVSGAHSHEKTDRADSHEDRVEHDFAHKLVAELEADREGGALKHLILVAPPKFLGQLRSALPSTLAALVVHSIDKDYSHVADALVHEHVSFG